MGRPYDPYKRKLMKHDPRCERCGAEAEPGAGSLHYHHTQPQHTGSSDHSEGVLVCARCHYELHAIERGKHKVVNEEGYTSGEPSPYEVKSKKNKRKREISGILSSYTKNH